jgi:hypothetical protein
MEFPPRPATAPALQSTDPAASRPPALDLAQRVLVLRDHLDRGRVDSLTREHEPHVVLCARPSYAHWAGLAATAAGQPAHVLAVMPASHGGGQLAGPLTVAGVAASLGSHDVADILAAPPAADIVFAPNKLDPFATHRLAAYIAASLPLLCVRGAALTRLRERIVHGQLVSELAVSSWALVSVDKPMRDVQALALPD